jgi:hypothetical protein
MQREKVTIQTMNKILALVVLILVLDFSSHLFSLLIFIVTLLIFVAF